MDVPYTGKRKEFLTSREKVYAIFILLQQAVVETGRLGTRGYIRDKSQGQKKD